LDYIAARFKEVGLEPAAGGSYLQKVPLLGVQTHIKKNELIVNGRRGTVRLRYWDDIVLWTLRAEKQLKVDRAEFVFVGFGIHAPEYGWDDYADIDVKGKVVVMLVNDPGFYDDNASGVAALALLGRRFSELPERPKRSILFLAVTAEESGLLGSEYYVKHPLYPLDKTVICLNIDSYGDNMRTSDVILSAPEQSETDCYVMDAAASQGRTVTFSYDNASGGYYRSDHFNFAKAGVPVALAKGGRYHRDPEAYQAHREKYYTQNHYHQPSDEYRDWWDVSGSLEDIYLFYGIGLRLSNDGYFPKWKDGMDYKTVREKTN
jgi:hypothetical protein